MDKSRSLLFAEDDYDEIYKRYFIDLPSWDSLDADISYWHNTKPRTLDHLNYSKESKYYRSDYAQDLFSDKQKILNGISHWEFTSPTPTSYCLGQLHCCSLSFPKI